jgi:hypothetical protein
MRFGVRLQCCKCVWFVRAWNAVLPLQHALPLFQFILLHILFVFSGYTFLVNIMWICTCFNVLDLLGHKNGLRFDFNWDGLYGFELYWAK